jgi:segregation and condensation protein A
MGDDIDNKMSIYNRVGHKPEFDIQSISNSNRVGQDQIHELLFSERLSWQAIIYDLINSEQLNPWDIDLSVLARKYLDKIKELEEANFVVSSKVLLAASLLLRLKSELLLNRDLQSLDEILYGKKEERKYSQERIELDEEIPALVPRTPLPRHRKVSLQELIKALSHAISTESRRIRRLVVLKQHELEAHLPIPRRLFNLQEKISGIYSKLKIWFSDSSERVAFSKLSETSYEDRLLTFVSLLHLDNQQKIWLEQDGHFEEIWILLKEVYETKNRNLLEKLKREVVALELEHVTEAEIEKVSGFSANNES